MSITPGEAVVLRVVRRLVENPQTADDVDKDDNGLQWVKVPAQKVSDLLLAEFNLSYSEARTRRSLNGLVTKGYLLRTSRIGEHKWRATYFYRLPAGESA
jgi:hypothetical protein